MTSKLTPDEQVPALKVNISKAFKEGEADIFCEPGLFWIRPDGRLYLADVSNMPWARPDLEFLQSKIPFAVEHQYPSRGGA